MEQLAKFVSEHIGEDISRLILAREKWPEIDMDMAVNCIESRRKIKGKVQVWYDNPALIFPVRLSSEQCSSSATASYKAALAERIIIQTSGLGESFIESERLSCLPWKIADLTGGLGVDTWYFSKKASKVLYNEMQTVLCEAAGYNFKVLGADNIVISNKAIGTGHDEASPADILSGFSPDIVYMDPARRSEGGKKVFLIEDCTPDALTLKEEIFGLCRNILIKLSPMADISMVCDRLGSTCREVHVVATGGECKELLIWMDKEWNAEYSVHVTELPSDYPDSEPSEFIFFPTEERAAVPEMYSTCNLEDKYLFEPGKALMKSGAFNLISARYQIAKLGRSTHYYALKDKSAIEELKCLGKIYEIIRTEPLDKRTMKSAGKDFPKAEVTARNIPMDTDTLRKKLGVTSGDDAHIFGLKSDSSGNLLLCTKRVF